MKRRMEEVERSRNAATVARQRQDYFATTGLLNPMQCSGRVVLPKNIREKSRSLTKF